MLQKYAVQHKLGWNPFLKGTSRSQAPYSWFQRPLNIPRHVNYLIDTSAGPFVAIIYFMQTLLRGLHLQLQIDHCDFVGWHARLDFPHKPPSPYIILPYYIQFKNIPKEVEIDMSKPEEGRMSRAGQVLVDLATKRFYWAYVTTASAPFCLLRLPTLEYFKKYQKWASRV